jgi:hypothetical protein
MYVDMGIKLYHSTALLFCKNYLLWRDNKPDFKSVVTILFEQELPSLRRVLLEKPKILC